jgi:bifunctional N-acetylglucosamine-1-phosphate-uridyltransferase/glucosamine-1-phosphate-acetyltransferase GlmU-like protein
LELVAWEAGRYRAEGDVRLPANHYLEGALIAGGDIQLDDGAAILGAVKARRHVHLGRGVQIHGALVCEGDIDIGPDCWIKGPIVCEGDVRLACGSRIGARHMPTTMAASRVLAETGVTAHGTVWARDAGVVAA